MKKLGCVGAIILFVLGLGISVEAVMNRPVTIGLNFGQYRSSLDFWNAQLRNEGSDKEFGQESIFGGSIAFGLRPSLRLRLDGSRWTGNVVEDQAYLGAVGIGTDDIAITLTPITISGLYHLPLMSRMAMYGGAGGGWCFVKVERTRSAKENIQSEDMTGTANFFGHMLIGLDLAVIRGISVSGEYKYALGKYVQQEKIAGVDKDRDVSISGPQFGFSLSYTFGPPMEAGPSVPTLFGGVRKAIRTRKEAIKAVEAEMETVKSRTEAVEAETEAVEAEIEAAESEKKAVEAEIYRLIQSDKAGVEAFVADLDGLIGRIRDLQRLSPDDLYKRKGEVVEIKERLEALKKNPISYLVEVADKIPAIEGMLVAQLEARIPKVPTPLIKTTPMAAMMAQPPDQHTVVRGDNLWNISKKEQIYNDPYMWPRIHIANPQIKDPDLIEPDWVLTIPRGVGPNQHLVVHGEWLSKIAGYNEVYGDVSKWHKLYQANRDQIADPDLIYPAQVLEIPRD